MSAAEIAGSRFVSLANGTSGPPGMDELPGVGAAFLAFALIAWIAMRVTGLSRWEAGLIAFVAPLGIFVNAPLGEPAPGMHLAGNVAGCLIPLLAAVSIIARRWRDTLAIALVMGMGITISFLASRAVPSRGILLHYEVCVIVIATTAIALFHKEPKQAGAVAFVGGTLGVFVGADMFRLHELMGGSRGSTITLGGASLLDGIFITAVLAALLATLGAWAIYHVRNHFVGETRRRPVAPRPAAARRAVSVK